jgi:hypothetical protein
VLPVSVSRVVYIRWTWPRTSTFVARRWQTWFDRSNFESLHESLGNQGTHSVHCPLHIHSTLDMSLPTFLQKLYGSRKLFVRILMYRPNHLLSLWSTILHWQTACWLFCKNVNAPEIMQSVEREQGAAAGPARTTRMWLQDMAQHNVVAGHGLW